MILAAADYFTRGRGRHHLHGTVFVHTGCLELIFVRRKARIFWPKLLLALLDTRQRQAFTRFVRVIRGRRFIVATIVAAAPLIAANTGMEAIAVSFSTSTPLTPTSDLHISSILKSSKIDL